MWDFRALEPPKLSQVKFFSSPQVSHWLPMCQQEPPTTQLRAPPPRPGPPSTISKPLPRAPEPFRSVRAPLWKISAALWRIAMPLWRIAMPLWRIAKLLPTISAPSPARSRPASSATGPPPPRSSPPIRLPEAPPTRNGADLLAPPIARRRAEPRPPYPRRFRGSPSGSDGPITSRSACSAYPVALRHPSHAHRQTVPAASPSPSQHAAPSQ